MIKIYFSKKIKKTEILKKPTYPWGGYYFADVDDDNGTLRSLLTDVILNKLNDSHTPYHMLNLKVGDICLLTRPVRAYGLASNQRVIIHKIPDSSNNLPPRLIEVFICMVLFFSLNLTT